MNGFGVLYAIIMILFLVLCLLGLASTFVPRRQRSRYNASQHSCYYRPQGPQQFYNPYYGSGPQGWQAYTLWEQDDPEATRDFSDRD